jgi:adenylate cyclase
MSETASPSPLPPLPQSFDDPLGRKIIELHVWSVGEGLRGTQAAPLFDGLCQHLVIAGVPLWRTFAGMRTLHPQWGGYAYTWWRDRGLERPAQFARGDAYEQDILKSPIGYLIREAQASGGREPWQNLRRRLTGPEAQLDFPGLQELASSGATDYFAEIIRFGVDGDTSRGTGIGYSFATDRPEGFRGEDLLLMKAVLPAVSLAMMAHASHTIASSLLGAYLGEDAGRRVHAGAVERGSVDGIRAVLWYADIRGFTAIADGMPGADVIELLDQVFEALAAPLRPCGGQVLKFIGDGMLAIFPFDNASRDGTCRSALDAAAEAVCAVDRLNAARREASKPSVAVDLALHLGEVQYGNIGAVDRLDFTVIGPAVNEVARIEALCEPLGCQVLVSAELAAAVDAKCRLVPLGCHALRGVREMQEIYGLDLGSAESSVAL